MKSSALSKYITEALGNIIGKTVLFVEDRAHSEGDKFYLSDEFRLYRDVVDLLSDAGGLLDSGFLAVEL